MTRALTVPKSGVANWEGLQFSYHLDEMYHHYVLEVSESGKTTQIRVTQDVLVEAFQGSAEFRQIAVYALVKAIQNLREGDE